MTQDEMTAFLEKNREGFAEAARKAIFAKVEESLKWQMPDGVQKAVNDFLAKEIVPEVSKILMGQRGAIIAAAQQSAVALSNTLAEKMMESVTKNLDSYRAEKVFKALLGLDRGY